MKYMYMYILQFWDTNLLHRGGNEFVQHTSPLKVHQFVSQYPNTFCTCTCTCMCYNKSTTWRIHLPGFTWYILSEDEHTFIHT